MVEPEYSITTAPASLTWPSMRTTADLVISSPLTPVSEPLSRPRPLGGGGAAPGLAPPLGDDGVVSTGGVASTGWVGVVSTGCDGVVGAAVSCSGSVLKSGWLASHAFSSAAPPSVTTEASV